MAAKPRPPDLHTVLKNRISMIMILFLHFHERYNDQPAFAKLLRTVRRALYGLKPLLDILDDDIPEDEDTVNDSVIGPHGAETMFVCPNAGWFVAEIDSLISQTNFELNPDNGFDTIFARPSWLTDEELETLRKTFARIARTFCMRINVFDDGDKIVRNPFGL